MWLRNLLDSLNLGRTRPSARHARRGPARRRPASGWLSVEALEDRSVPASFSVGSATILEGNAGTTTAAVVVRLDVPTNKTVTVNYSTANGTATAGSDYKAVSGTLTFAQNETSKTILVPVIGDRAVEPDEYFRVLLSNPTKGAKIANATGVVTVLDDEPRVSINDVYVSEGNAGTTSATFTVSLSGEYDQAVTVNYATADGTARAGGDYAPASGAVSFSPGVTSQTITVQVYGDRLAEQNETFLVNLSAPNSYAQISRGTGYGTITDDEPQISIADAYYYDGDAQSLTFTVSLSAADPDQAVTLDYVTADGSAYAGVDYAFTSGTLTFAPGVTTTTFTVPLLGSATYDQYFTVQLSNASGNASIATGSAYGYLNPYGGGGYGYDPGFSSDGYGYGYGF